MDKVLVDRGLLAECVSVCIRAFGVGDPIEAKLRAILAQPAEAEGIDLHDEIMNLRCDAGQCPVAGVGAELAYKTGHRDARHAAAGMAAGLFTALSAVTAERDRLREAVELLSRLRGLINCTPENDVDKVPVWISTKHPTVERIDALLAAMAAKEA